MTTPPPLPERVVLDLIVDTDTIPLARVMLALAYYASGGSGTAVAEAAIMGREVRTGGEPGC